MGRAFLFPGQGSQAVGMGRELGQAMAAAREVFEEVDEALQQHLSRLMFEGPESELLLTENAQPALFAVSLAVARVLEREGGFRLADKAVFVAGHSLGEYSALAAAGALSISDGARLLKLRGRTMQQAVPLGEGAMAALLGCELDVAAEVALEATKEGSVCAVANDNGPGQVVISGYRQGVERAIELFRAKGGRRSIMLPVSAPFHCPLMQPAADAMAEALKGTEIRAPAPPVIANVTARETDDPEQIRKLLVEQVTAMVRWRETVLYLKERNVDKLVEVGAGYVLSGLAKRISPDFALGAVHTPADVEAFFKSL